PGIEPDLHRLQRRVAAPWLGPRLRPFGLTWPFGLARPAWLTGPVWLAWPAWRLRPPGPAGLTGPSRPRRPGRPRLRRHRRLALPTWHDHRCSSRRGPACPRAGRTDPGSPAPG